MIHLISRHVRIILPACLALFINACQEDPSRHLNLGNWYLQKGLIDEAIMEYREVARLFSGDQSQLTRDEFKILGNAHIKLAISKRRRSLPLNDWSAQCDRCRARYDPWI